MFRPTQAGFSLLEVLVALAVVATALAAATSAVSTNVRQAAGLQERTMAHWVGMNKLTELQVTQYWPRGATTERGSSEMAGHHWFWSFAVRKTDDPDIHRVDIQVRTHEDDPAAMATLTGFIDKPFGSNGR